ncbi:T9SS type A sorting domain-containing protein [Pontibacter sp. 13R65]|uniref:T9SS type A sorting domain-containing protein n=1 Tax=Pontibacter sp. 13R65 TaxID=3127458 RepID=UPI00301C86F1
MNLNISLLTIALLVLLLISGETANAQDRVWERIDTPFNGVASSAVDHEGTLWVGMTRDLRPRGAALYFWNGSSWGAYDYGGRHYHTNDILIDKTGVRWFATSAGAFSFDGTTWKNYNDDLKIVRDEDFSEYANPANVITIQMDKDGVLWFQTYDNRIVRYDGTFWRDYITMPNNVEGKFKLDKKGGFWIRASKGLLHFDGLSWVQHTFDENSTDEYSVDNNFRDLTIDDNGIIWAVSSYKLRRYNGSSWTTYEVGKELPFSDLTCVTVNNDGKVWLGTADGTFIFQGDDNWHLFRPPGAGGGPGFGFNSIRADENGKIWVTKNYHGLFVLYNRPLSSAPAFTDKSDKIVYPNPAIDFVKIIGDHLGSDVSIYNLEGALLSNQKLRSPETSLDIRMLPQGIYVMRIKNKNGTTTEKLVKK